MSEKRISKAVISRLPRYYRYLGELMNSGVERISSRELSQKMRVTASQIRQDLNNFGGFGQQGYGYNVGYLHEVIGEILGLKEMRNMIIIGAGNLGQALANYQNFERSGFKIIALFDINPVLKGMTVRGIPVLMMEEMADFISRNKVEVATLTIPKSKALETAEILVNNGVKAIWNFAHTDLNLVVPKDVVVENVHLSESLMRLSYNLSRKENQNLENSLGAKVPDHLG